MKADPGPIIRDGYDPGLIRGRAPAAKVIECPCCGHQGLVRVVRHLPEGYDDPNHPIGIYPLSQVGIVVAEVSWASMSQTEEDDNAKP